MKTQVVNFIHTLALYDYLLFGGIVFIFAFFLILAVLLHHHIKTAITLILLAFLTIVTAPYSGYQILHATLYKHTIALTTVQDLAFSDILLVRGDINNTSTKTFKECTVTIGISKTHKIKQLNKIYPYIPYRSKKVTLNGPIKPNESQNFKLLIEPFKTSKKFNVTAHGVCR
jgi:hypothetical protein